MFSKKDIENFLKTTIDKMRETENLYKELTESVEDMDLKEDFLLLNFEEHGLIHLLEKVEVLFLNNWKE